MLRQEVSYFDNPKNNTGALCTRLATEASAVQGASGVRIGVIFQNLASLGTGIIISFVFSWQLTLLVLAFVPLMVAGGFLQSRLMTGFASKDKQTFEDAGKVSLYVTYSVLFYLIVSFVDNGRIYSKYSNSRTINKRRLLSCRIL
jgi:ABC-type multidrug transport system fused ATPase/permease subunit